MRANNDRLHNNKLEPLHHALNRYLLAVLVLTEPGAKQNCRHYYLLLKLQLTARNGRAENVTVLLANGAMIGSQDTVGCPAVHCTAWDGRASLLCGVLASMEAMGAREIKDVKRGTRN